MRIFFTGSREWTDLGYAFEIFHSLGPLEEVGHGDARGLDALVKLYYPDEIQRVYPADWKRYGKAAGMLRNEEGLDDFKPDAVAGFLWRGARNAGTQGCMALARDKGIPIIGPFWGGPEHP